MSKQILECERVWIPRAYAGKWYLTDTSKETQKSIKKLMRKGELRRCLFAFFTTLCRKMEPNGHFGHWITSSNKTIIIAHLQKCPLQSIFLHRFGKNANRHLVTKNLLKWRLPGSVCFIFPEPVHENETWQTPPSDPKTVVSKTNVGHLKFNFNEPVEKNDASRTPSKGLKMALNA